MEASLDARALTPSGPFSQAIAEELVEASSREGADVYLAARDVANPRLSRSRYVYEAGTADSELRASPDPARLAGFYELEARGFARTASAVRRHVRLFQAEAARAGGSEEARLAVRDAALWRLVASSLDAMDAREKRLSAWLSSRAVTPR
jgi:hypothetical protein